MRGCAAGRSGRLIPATRIDLTPPRQSPVQSRYRAAPMPYSAFACLAGWGLSYPRVRTQLGPPSDSGGKGDAGEEVSGELVVSRGDAAEVLEAAEHALDEIALPIKDEVVRDQRLASGD